MEKNGIGDRGTDASRRRRRASVDLVVRRLRSRRHRSALPRSALVTPALRFWLPPIHQTVGPINESVVRPPEANSASSLSTPTTQQKKRRRRRRRRRRGDVCRASISASGAPHRFVRNVPDAAGFDVDGWLPSGLSLSLFQSKRNSRDICGGGATVAYRSRRLGRRPIVRTRETALLSVVLDKFGVRDAVNPRISLVCCFF